MSRSGRDQTAEHLIFQAPADEPVDNGTGQRGENDDT
jgi:hypothetical protein